VRTATRCSSAVVDAALTRRTSTLAKRREVYSGLKLRDEALASGNEEYRFRDAERQRERPHQRRLGFLSGDSNIQRVATATTGIDDRVEHLHALELPPS